MDPASGCGLMLVLLALLQPPMEWSPAPKRIAPEENPAAQFPAGTEFAWHASPACTASDRERLADSLSKHGMKLTADIKNEP